MAKQFTLGKNERLKSRKQIEQLFKEGKTFSVFPFKIYYVLDPVQISKITETSNASCLPPPISCLPPPASQLLFGVGAGTRNFKKAVDRNRIKRLTREGYRLQKTILQQRLLEMGKKLNVFFIYTGKEIPDHLLVKEKTAHILNRLIKIVDENTAVGS